ncbi:MAG: undecaprenyldiphospho-muramoylpentapeptide beta-N-acetylglucosaminyltransferase [Erysipelotrichaceae bacterium]|jgi:UDP-N-acetylglucosamine--N-acetylmuramyl-(pentapeptide) pyrophosphoryl-undecaprenol N-acetylglucosamine transferase|nr:undecaprenyldiphospho-muramoylpentapeptide beta-N-acetylglucosaminyltransferase [Erysipelotrichaceae bacterium]
MRVCIATGGTGGHIYPAIALAQKLKEDDPDNRILFLGTKNHMESVLVPQAGFDFLATRGRGLRGNPIQKAMAVFGWWTASRQLKKQLKEFKPQVLIGFGGYASVPAVLALKGQCPVFLHEQNAFPGKANRFLARYAQKVITCYPEAEQYFPKDKVVLLGNPRASIAAALQKKDDALQKKEDAFFKQYQLNPKEKLLFAFMGSQGSESVNEMLVEVFSKPLGAQVLYATGKAHYDLIKSKLPDSKSRKVVDYVDGIKAMANADLILARGGATSAAEIAALGKASVIIPSPYVPDDAQVKNTRYLSEAGAAVMLEEKKLSVQSLWQTLSDLIQDDIKRSTMAAKAKALGKPQACSDIISLLKASISHG